MFGFLFFFFLSPVLYAYVSVSKDDKRTDYPGKEIAMKTQYAWDQQFNSKINVVLGDEWNAGNLSYHLKSRPVWEGQVLCSQCFNFKMLDFKSFVDKATYWTKSDGNQVDASGMKIIRIP